MDFPSMKDLLATSMVARVLVLVVGGSEYCVTDENEKSFKIS
jgi:hypothetical protein